MNSSTKLIPVMTEKSMRLTKSHGFTFYVPISLTKVEIKALIEKAFAVEVIKVRTISMKAATKRNTRGKIQKIKALKKAIVILKEGNKIDLFEEEKKKTKKKVKSAKS